MDNETFTQCVERYGDAVYLAALHACGSPADAEDIAQNAFIKLLERQESFENEEHLRRWLIRVTVNEGKSLVCSRWFRSRAALEEYAGTVDFEAPEETELFLAVMALPSKYRVPVYLFYYEDYSVKEVASMCGLKVSTVQTRLQRAREKLRKELLAMTERTETGRKPKRFILRRLAVAAAVMVLAVALAMGVNAATGGELYDITIGKLICTLSTDNGWTAKLYENAGGEEFVIIERPGSTDSEDFETGGYENTVTYEIEMDDDGNISMKTDGSEDAAAFPHK